MTGTSTHPTGPSGPVEPTGDVDPAEQVLTERRAAGATAVLGGVMLLMGVVTLVQAIALDDEGELVSAATAPYVVGALTVVVGVLLVVRGRRDLAALRGGRGATASAQAATSEHRQDWARMGVLVAVLVVFALVVPFLGYVVSATLLFAATAVALGAPYRLRAVAQGFSVAVLVFLAFDVGIGIALPAGPWGF